MSRIEELIDDMEAYIEDCKPAAFSSSKVVINKEEFAEMLNELRLQIPEEVTKCQKILNNQSAILDNAKAQAEGLVSEANRLQSQMVDEHEIMRKAYDNADKIIANANEQGQAIVDKAAADAAAMKRSIMKYSDDMMIILQKTLEDMMNTSKGKFDSFYNSLNQNYNTVCENREALNMANSQDNEI